MKQVLLAAAAALAATSAMSATFYTSEVDWTAAMSSTTAVPLPVTGATTSFSAGDLTFSRTGSATNLIVGTPDEWSTLIPGNDLAISAPEDVLIDFGTAVTGFGFLMHEPASSTAKTDGCNAACFDSTFNFKLFAGAVEIGSFDFLPGDDVASFVGFSSATPFDRVVIDDVTNTIDNEFFGAFRTGAVVPLPAGLPLLLAGLGVLVGLRRLG